MIVWYGRVPKNLHALKHNTEVMQEEEPTEQSSKARKLEVKIQRAALADHLKGTHICVAMLAQASGVFTVVLQPQVLTPLWTNN